MEKLPTSNPRIFHTGWKHVVNSLYMVDHYFAEKDDGILVVAATKGVSMDVAPLITMSPFTLSKNEMTDNTKEAFELIKSEIDK